MSRWPVGPMDAGEAPSGRRVALEADRAGVPSGHPGTDRDQHPADSDPKARGAAGPDGPPGVAVSGHFGPPTLEDPVVSQLMKQEGMHGSAFGKAVGRWIRRRGGCCVDGVPKKHRCAAMTSSEVEGSPEWPVAGRQ